MNTKYDLPKEPRKLDNGIRFASDQYDYYANERRFWPIFRMHLTDPGILELHFSDGRRVRCFLGEKGGTTYEYDKHFLYGQGLGDWIKEMYEDYRNIERIIYEIDHYSKPAFIRVERVPDQYDKLRVWVLDQEFPVTIVSESQYRKLGCPGPLIWESYRRFFDWGHRMAKSVAPWIHKYGTEAQKAIARRHGI